jgi:hypothetical protein
MRIALLGAIAAALVAGALPAAADPPREVSSYYLARADPRLCPSPKCGGLWVRLVNKSRTTCGDGSVRRECYVAVVHLSLLHLGERRAMRLGQLITAGRALVRGKLVPEEVEDFTLDGLVVSEIWAASSSARKPTGTFRKLTDNGVRCVTTPCFSVHAATLNGPRHAEVSGFDLAASGARAAERSAAVRRISKQGLIVAGRVVRVPDAGLAGPGRTVVASQFYVHATR